jgi:hypothetical protein
MSAPLIILTGLFVTVAIGAVAALAWLGRTLRWEVVEDDRLDYEPSVRRGPTAAFRAWLRRRSWLGSKRRLLTYRRDELGRFRRYRR